MHQPANLSRLTAFATACLALAACSSDERPDDAEDAPSAEAKPRGTYDVDPETGETRARFKGDDGTVTTMRAGDKVPVSLPKGFTVYPDAEIAYNTRVEQADGQLVLVNLTSKDAPEKLVEHYRRQAEAAGIDVDTSLQTGPMTMIGGNAADGSSFTFTATRSKDTTEAQLSLGYGFR